MPLMRLASQVMVATPWQKWPCRWPTWPWRSSVGGDLAGLQKLLEEDLAQPRVATAMGIGRPRWRQARASALPSAPSPAQRMAAAT